MEPTSLARWLAASRVATGAALFAAPALAGRRWIGADAEGAGTTVALRGLGARDVALGIGLIVALESGRPAHRWLEASALADLGDATGMLLAGDDVPATTRAATVVVAAGAAGLGIWLSRTLTD